MHLEIIRTLKHYFRLCACTGVKHVHRLYERPIKMQSGQRIKKVYTRTIRAQPKIKTIQSTWIFFIFPVRHDQTNVQVQWKSYYGRKKDLDK